MKRVDLTKKTLAKGTGNIFFIRRDLIKLWKKNNPILEKDEPALETDTRRLRIGDGVHTFKDLPYYGPLKEYER